MGNVLVFAEHQNGKFPKSTLIAVQAGKEAAGSSPVMSSARFTVAHVETALELRDLTN